MPFKLHPLEIPGVVRIEPLVHQDERGFFMETYQTSEFSALGIASRFVQDCHSRSPYAVLRGLHFQKTKPQAKLIRVIRGEIFDVVVDIRAGASTYGRWVSTKLSEANRQMLYIPAGFAHGFCVLSETAEVLYKMTEKYLPEDEGGIRWDDPELGIRWPIPNPILSEKDRAFPCLKDVEAGWKEKA